MKVHYINILLFALPLNILVNIHKKTSITHHTQTNRSLCECELYMSNYDNHPQMKKVMQQFEDRTTQRFHEYDDRMLEKRKQCKDQCDKEIQKIILKDKLEKELMDKFATLDTDIQNDAIPTCVCEKSMADKVEKGCLRCAQNLGGIVLPSTGVIGEIAALSLNAWKNAAITSAIDFATEAGIKAGIAKVIANIKEIPSFNTYLNAVDWTKYITKLNYNTVHGLADAAKAAIKSIGKTCPDKKGNLARVCNRISHDSEGWFRPVVTHGEEAAAIKTVSIKNVALERIDTAFLNNTTAITASVVAIVVIVLIMVIIYLILRYRRKKKMKKKLQYIKLLEE
ncbi:rifin PIR protein, putative [Plasmodium reichenowi]|uniref:Rifin PIR protein, putative n=1 Tax=Plasmodium reichenowi TaxID=5854 RepID=A0A2P9D1H4_PLARE|nr:rifin PIR protein, putative [Plasmodium reichenowi]